MGGNNDAPSERTVAQTGNILRWLRLNLAVLLAATSVVTALGSALIAIVLRAGEVSHDIADLAKSDAAGKAAISQLHADMVDVDRRLNSGGSATGDVQRACETRAAQLEQRIAVLEAQVRFVADRLPTQSLGARR